MANKCDWCGRTKQGVSFSAWGDYCSQKCKKEALANMSPFKKKVKIVIFILTIIFFSYVLIRGCEPENKSKETLKKNTESSGYNSEISNSKQNESKETINLQKTEELQKEVISEEIDDLQERGVSQESVESQEIDDLQIIDESQEIENSQKELTKKEKRQEKRQERRQERKLNNDQV